MKNNVYRITHVRGTTRNFKFLSCRLDKKNEKMYVISNSVCGKPILDIYSAKYIKKVECIERNNNYQ